MQLLCFIVEKEMMNIYETSVTGVSLGPYWAFRINEALQPLRGYSCTVRQDFTSPETWKDSLSNFKSLSRNLQLCWSPLPQHSQYGDVVLTLNCTKCLNCHWRSLNQNGIYLFFSIVKQLPLQMKIQLTDWLTDWQTGSEVLFKLHLVTFAKFPPHKQQTTK